MGKHRVFGDLNIEKSLEKRRLRINYWFENNKRVTFMKLRARKGWVAVLHDSMECNHPVAEMVNGNMPFYDPVGFPPFISSHAVVVPKEMLCKKCPNPHPKWKLYQEMLKNNKK